MQQGRRLTDIAHVRRRRHQRVLPLLISSQPSMSIALTSTRSACGKSWASSRWRNPINVVASGTLCLQQKARDSKKPMPRQNYIFLRAIAVMARRLGGMAETLAAPQN